MIDSKTISAVIDGNPQAFEKVYLQTHDKAYSIAYRILKDEYEAEDIVQDAYLTMIEKLCDLKEAERLEGWFYRIVQNGAKDNLRKRHAEVFSSFDNDEEDFQFSDTIVSDYTPFDPEATADYEELKRIMDGFVMGLPEMQRKCILLRFRGDKKISEIAQMLGIPEATVKSNLNYGKRKIEGEVRALEKQGVKLYSLTPLTVIAFLRWMWGKPAASAVTAGIKAASATAAAGAAATASGGAAAASGGAAAAGGGTAVGAASSAGGAAAAAKTGLALGVKKLIAGVCAAAVVGGGTAGVLLSQPEKQLEKIVTVEKEGRYEDVFPRSYCLPQISDSEHDWTELNQGLQLAYESWESSSSYHSEHPEEFKTKVGEEFYQIMTSGKYPGRTDCRFAFYLSPPFLIVNSGTGYWNYGLPTESPPLSDDQAIAFIKSRGMYCMDTGKSATHEDMRKYLGLTEEAYLQMLHNNLDEALETEYKRSLELIPEDVPAEYVQDEMQQQATRRDTLSAIGHSLIGSDTFSWNYPCIYYFNGSFYLELFDDVLYDALFKAATSTSREEYYSTHYDHPSILIPICEATVTETAYCAFGETKVYSGMYDPEAPFTYT